MHVYFCQVGYEVSTLGVQNYLIFNILFDLDLYCTGCIVLLQNFKICTYLRNEYVTKRIKSRKQLSISATTFHQLKCFTQLIT